MNERLPTLVQKIYEKTKSGEIAWQKSPSRGFLASFPTYSIGLYMQEGRAAPRVQMSIYNEEGEIVERFFSTELQAAFGPDAPGPRGLLPRSDFEALMHDLYNMARRAALDADRVVDRILADLER